MGYHDRIQPPVLLGLNAKERKEYSIIEGLRNIALVAEGKAAPPCLAFDVHKSLERLTGRSSPGLLVPVLDLAWQRSPMQTSQPNLGGNAVSTIVSNEWIEALRNNLVVSRAGARLISDLNGNVDFPKLTGTSQVHWVSEGETIPETNVQLSLVSLRPQDVACRTAVTRRLLMQSSVDVEAVVRADLISVVSEAIDRAVLTGSGLNNEPQGITNTPGVNHLEIGSNGGPLDWEAIVAMETEVSASNADAENAVYIGNSATRGYLKKTQKVAGQAVMLWESEPGPDPNTRLGVVNGYTAYCTNLLPSDGTKGTGNDLSTFLYGDFSQVILGNWGVLELLPNPYGAGYPSGTIELRCMATVGVANRHPQAFAVYQDVATA